MDSDVMEQRVRQWMSIFKEQANSGLNKKDWCRQNGIKRSAFFRWQRECRAYLLSKQQTLPPEKAEPAFVEISCTKSEAAVVPTTDIFHSAIDSSSIIISCNGFSVSVNGQVDEINLAKVLKVISYAH